MKLSIASDLEKVGTNPEFADIDNPNGYIYEERFWVQATLEDGTRYDHYYITADQAAIHTLLNRINFNIDVRGSCIALDNSKVWAMGTPVYGSKAYQMFGGEERLCQLEEFEDRY